MHNRLSTLAIVLLLAALSAGCDLIGGVFKAGLVSGVIVVVLMLAAIVWVVSKLRR